MRSEVTPEEKNKNPPLTDFEPDVGEHITRLKSSVIKFLEELFDKDGRVENAIAESPDG